MRSRSARLFQTSAKYWNCGPRYSSKRPLEDAAWACPATSENERVNSARVEVTNGEVLYDGESLAVWALRVADRIVERFGANRVVLYGSVARGDDGPESDIDLLVVMPIVGSRHDAAVRALNELRGMPVPVDITVVDPAHLDEEASVPGVVRAAMREGRALVLSRSTTVFTTDRPPGTP